MIRILLFLLFTIIKIHISFSQTDPLRPNVILIIADDMGTDVTPGYLTGNTPMPVTPNIDALRSSGVTFTNAWATPQCTPTRASIMSGKYGINTGVQKVPGLLDATTHTSIFKELANQTANAYSDAVIGKWHIHNTTDYTHPTQHGVDFYTGVFNSSVPDYYNWDKLVGASLVNETTYATEDFTDEAITWVNSRTSPFFLWLAHVAPHAPSHVPPVGTYTVSATNSFRRYVASIEAMDYYIGRLFSNIPTPVLDNTVVIFIGDNGTPNNHLKSYPATRGKGSVYQGGINVPFIVSGKGVTRVGETENAMVNIVDIYATILEIAGASLPGGIYNSFSFHPLLSNSSAPQRPYNYIDYQSKGTGGDDFAVRDSQYKLIQFSDGTREFYDLIADPFELNNLLPSLSVDEQIAYDDLVIEATYIRTDWSCRDLIQNGIETSIDIGGTYCAGLPVCTYNNFTSTTNIGCCDTPLPDESQYSEAVYNGVRYISTTNFPDHDYCYNTPAQKPTQIFRYFEVNENPTLAAEKTSITNITTNRPDMFFGVALNGVKMAPAPATPFIFENANTGEFNWDWIFEPTNNQGSGPDVVGLDCSSAHTGNQGYHYHGNMFEYAENIQAGLSTTTTAPSGPIQIGWASDGFPVLYRFAPDGVGGLALLQPSYRLKPGDRPGDGINSPCGPYNGKYTNDYEFVLGSGDLDECNGIARDVTLNTVCGPQTFNYFYVVTDSFPQISRCLSGTPNISFDNGTGSESCYRPLFQQKITLNAGESINVGTNTYNSVGEYQDIINNWDSSCDSMVVTRITAVLPLALLEFNARLLQNNTVYLNWTTTDETNFSHFMIQKSFDAVTWEDISEVRGKGNLNALNYYSLKDEIFNNNPIIYYRLKMVDIDGTFKYSSIQSVDIKSSNHYSIYHDFSNNEIIVQSIHKDSELLEISIMDIQGKEIYKKHITIHNGKNIVFNNLNHLSQGIYLVRISNHHNLNLVHKIIINP